MFYKNIAAALRSGAFIVAECSSLTSLRECFLPAIACAAKLSRRCTICQGKCRCFMLPLPLLVCTPMAGRPNSILNLDQPPFSVCPRCLVVFYLLVGKHLEKGAQVLLKIRRAIFLLKHRSSYFICLSLLCLPGFNPFAGIYKSFQPWRYLVLSACRVVRPVPLKYRTFNVRHCNQMTSGAVTHHRRIEA